MGMCPTSFFFFKQGIWNSLSTTCKSLLGTCGKPSDLKLIESALKWPFPFFIKYLVCSTSFSFSLLAWFFCGCADWLLCEVNREERGEKRKKNWDWIVFLLCPQYNFAFCVGRTGTPPPGWRRDEPFVSEEYYYICSATVEAKTSFLFEKWRWPPMSGPVIILLTCSMKTLPLILGCICSGSHCFSRAWQIVVFQPSPY